jgi:hypothetical protein
MLVQCRCIDHRMMQGRRNLAGIALVAAFTGAIDFSGLALRCRERCWFFGGFVRIACGHEFFQQFLDIAIYWLRPACWHRFHQGSPSALLHTGRHSFTLGVGWIVHDGIREVQHFR